MADPHPSDSPTPWGVLTWEKIEAAFAEFAKTRPDMRGITWMFRVSSYVPADTVLVADRSVGMSEILRPSVDPRYLILAARELSEREQLDALEWFLVKEAERHAKNPTTSTSKSVVHDV
jgi:hypothetical protein